MEIYTMTLQEIIEAVDALPLNEMQQVRQHIEQRETDEENPIIDIDAVEKALAELREGFSEEDLEELEWAMNVEYIEPLDEKQNGVAHKPARFYKFNKKKYEKNRTEVLNYHF